MKFADSMKRYLFQNHNLEIISSIILTIPLTYLFINSIWVTIYFHFTILYLFTQRQIKHRTTKHEKVEYKRKFWLKYLIENRLRELNYYSYNTEFQISELLNLPLDKYYKLEISLQSDDKYDDLFIIPDLLEAEVELLNQDTRISQILVSIVFVPLVYYFFHIIYPISMMMYLLNTVNMILVIENLSFQIRHPIILEDWQKLHTDLNKLKQQAISDPHHFLFNLKDYFENIYLTELSLNPILKNNISSHTSLHQLISVLMKYNQDIRKYLIEEFISSAKNIAEIEAVHIKKWKALRMQFIYVVSSVMLFLAILTSIFSILMKLTENVFVNLGPGILNFNKLILLTEFTLLVTLILVHFLSQPYLTKNHQRLYLIIWALEFILIKLFLDLTFNYLLVN
ncbi:MAG: hypothetical protein ACW99A_02735 [Candidatus Kariarchaeaceae archaeon]|jgi:hypothetical protein